MLDRLYHFFYILLKRVYKKGRKKKMDTRSYTMMIYNYIFNSALLMISYMFLFYNFICCFVSGIKIFFQKKKSFYILSLLCRGEVTTACILATLTFMAKSFEIIKNTDITFWKVRGQGHLGHLWGSKYTRGLGAFYKRT